MGEFNSSLFKTIHSTITRGPYYVGNKNKFYDGTTFSKDKPSQFELARFDYRRMGYLQLHI